MDTSSRRLLVLLVGGVAVLLGLYFASLYNYLLFHTLAEGFAIAVACGIFMVAWNSRRFLQNNYVLFLGVAYLFVGGLDLLHTLAYKGMNVFPGYGTNLPTQLWIGARYMEAFSLLAAPLFLGRRLSGSRALAGYAVASVALLWAIFGDAFPTCFVEGQGLTPFKKASEYVISGILLGSIYTLHRRREVFEKGVLRLIYISVLATIASEMAFTFYVSAYGFSNLVGHYLKLLSFVLIYRAVIVTGLREPYNLLFRDLKLSEEKYHSLFAEMLNGFAYHEIVLDESGRPVDYVFLEVNDSFERFTGLKKDDVVGRRVTEVIPGIERDPADWIGIYGSVALTGREARFEQYSEPLGKWFSVSAYSPKKGHFGVVFEDITERKRAEEQLRLNEARLSALHELSLKSAESLEDLAFFVQDKAVELTKSKIGFLGFLDVAEKNMTLYGWSREAMKECGMIDRPLVFPVEGAGLWAEAIRRREPVVVNDYDHTELARKGLPKGHVAIKRVLSVPVFEKGKIVAVVVVGNKETDYDESDLDQLSLLMGGMWQIYERKRAEEALRESENRYRTLFKEIDEGFCIIEVIFDEKEKPIDYRFLDVNPAFEKQTGLVDAQGRTMRELAPHHEEHWFETYGRIALTGQSARFQNRAQQLHRWYDVYAFRFGEPEDRQVAVLFNDITERKRAEELMNRYQDHLEELVAERTADLVAANEDLEQEISQRTKAEAQLLQSQKMEAVGQLAGGIAHDFNNRLFAIRNYAYALKSTTGDPQAAENAERILASCDRAAKLVDDLLSFSRKKEINPKPVDVVKVISEAESLLRVAAGKRVDFRLELPAEPLTVMADATVLEHALINLVTNARDAMAEGGTVTVRAGKGESGKEFPATALLDGGQRGAFAVISVSDTGPGMDAKTKEKIFEPFFSTKEPGKGTGLGLSMVYGTVTQQGGFVDAQSEAGRGTTLSIYLPLIPTVSPL